MNFKARLKRRQKSKNFKLILLVLFFILLGSTAICKNSFSDTINLGNANVISNVLSNEEAQLIKEKKELKKTDEKFTKKKIFKSTQAEHVVSKKQIESAALMGEVLLMHLLWHLDYMSMR